MKFKQSLITLTLAFLFLPGHSSAKEGLDGRFALRSGLLTNILAKEICSCVFIQEAPLKECLQRSNLNGLALKMVHVVVRRDVKTVRVAPTAAASLPLVLGAPIGKAQLNLEKPYLGCRAVVDENPNVAWEGVPADLDPSLIEVH